MSHTRADATATVTALLTSPHYCLRPIMSGFDANRVYSVGIHDRPAASAPDSASETERLLLDFLLQYRVGGEFIYRHASSHPDASRDLLNLC